mgnify:FL=1
MENSIKEVQINTGIEGICEVMNTVNLVDCLQVLHKFYGVSYKKLSDHSGINYSSLRCMCCNEENVLSEEKTADAVKKLKQIYSINK